MRVEYVLLVIAGGCSHQLHYHTELALVLEHCVAF